MYFSNSHFCEIKFSSPLLIETIEPLDKQIIHKINLLHTRICFSFCSNILFKYFPFYLSFLPFFYLTLIKNNPTLISNKTKKIVFTNFRNLLKKKKKKHYPRPKSNFIRTNYFLYLSLIHPSNNPKLITTHQIPRIPKLKYFLPTRSTSNLCNFPKKKKKKRISILLYSFSPRFKINFIPEKLNRNSQRQTRCRSLRPLPPHHHFPSTSAPRSSSRERMISPRYRRDYSIPLPTLCVCV